MKKFIKVAAILLAASMFFADCQQGSDDSSLNSETLNLEPLFDKETLTETPENFEKLELSDGNWKVQMEISDGDKTHTIQYIAILSFTAKYKSLNESKKMIAAFNYTLPKEEIPANGSEIAKQMGYKLKGSTLSFYKEYNKDSLKEFDKISIEELIEVSKLPEKSMLPPEKIGSMFYFHLINELHLLTYGTPYNDFFSDLIPTILEVKTNEDSTQYFISVNSEGTIEKYYFLKKTN